MHFIYDQILVQIAIVLKTCNEILMLILELKWISDIIWFHTMFRYSCTFFKYWPFSSTFISAFSRVLQRKYANFGFITHSNANQDTYSVFFFFHLPCTNKPSSNLFSLLLVMKMFTLLYFLTLITILYKLRLCSIIFKVSPNSYATFFL